MNNVITSKREAIYRAEKAMLSLPQIDLKAQHYFAEGLCARELFMPKGSFCTGKIHVKEHLVVIPFGDVLVSTDEGTERIVGPITFVGKPGSKRALFMYEDTLWIAIHASDVKTQEEAENTLVTNDHNEYLRVREELKCLTS